MEFERTRNHEIIREWIEVHNGEPVELLLGGDAEGLIGLNFGWLLPEDYRVISWEEFFAWFDSHHLAFRYSKDVARGQEELSYNFVSGRNVSDSREDEQELPEDSRLAEENLDNAFQSPDRDSYSE